MELIEVVLPKVEQAEGSATYGKFVAEPLERGFGITLGNALRRVLLSSLPGAAITWMKIDGVLHEFSTIPHVKEDTMGFLLNVKAIRIRPLANRPGTLYLEAKGEGEVTAGHIQPSADFEILNTEQRLATLDSLEARLTVEFNVELGRGYRPVGKGYLEGKESGLPIEVIPVDAIFTPVRRVNFTTEPVRPGLETAQERLVLEVWTDGTIPPIEAVSQASQILEDNLIPFLELTRPRVAADKEKKVPVLPPEKYNVPLEELGLSMRTYNCLKRAGIDSLGQLVEKTEKELMELRHFGQKSLEEVQERLGVLGLALGGGKVGEAQ
jgi:DNA-directed RNA polymerase subunit alpha